MTLAQVENVYVEALSSGVPKVQVESVYVEALSLGEPKARAESVYVEVLVPSVSIISGDAALVTGSTLTSAGSVVGILTGTASLSSGSTLVAGDVLAGTVALSASSTLTAAASTALGGATALTASTTLVAGSSAIRFATGALAQSSAITIVFLSVLSAEAHLTQTSTLTVSGAVIPPGALFNPVSLPASPVSVAFSTGHPTPGAAPHDGSSSSNDLWYWWTATGVETTTFNWSGPSAGLELWTSMSSAFSSVDEITYLSAGVGSLVADVGEGNTYLIRVHPISASDNSGSGTLTYSTVARGGTGTLEITTDPALSDTPAGLKVRVSQATPGGGLEFRIGGDLIGNALADDAGQLIDWTVEVPELAMGSHTIEVTDQDTGDTATADFLVLRLPTVPPPWVDPSGEITIPTPTGGVERWIFWDVHPGGEYYTVPVNPATMTNPHDGRVIASQHTTHPGGQPLLFEGARTVVDWTVEGTTFTQAHVEALERFHALNRRFWIVDHLSRGWVVSFEELDWTELKATAGPWTRKYKLKFFILRGPVT